MAKEETGNPPLPADDTLNEPQPFPNPRAHDEFYNTFNREADEYDSGFIKKYDDDVTVTLIHAGFFSVVTSIFIVSIQSKLEPDYTQMSYTLLTIVARASLGEVPTGPDAAFPQWTGPDPTIVHVQTILYSSLAASLLAAFVAVLAKQWINRYSRTEMYGSVIDRSRRRQRKMEGMATWHFDVVMESLPLILQAALLLLGYALSSYLFTINHTVAGAVVGFTASGVLFYLLIISAATLSYNCPFQTPASFVIRSMLRLDEEHKERLRRTRKWFWRTLIFSNKTQQQPVGPYTRGSFNKSDASATGDHIELTMAGAAEQQAPLFSKETDWNGYVLDSNCIARMFEMSTDTDVTLAIIPEVVWHAGIRTIPLERLYDTLLKCFDHSSGRPVVIPNLRNRAYLSAKALLHLTIQRQCIGYGSDRAVFTSISNRHPIIGSRHYEGDSDLESTLDIIDRVFGGHGGEEIHWQTFSFSVPHHAWMAHILLYRAWDVLRKGQPLPDDVRGFVLHSLRLEPPPPAQIVTDCLFIIGLVLGIKLHVDDLLVTDKSCEQCQQVNRIYEKLVETFSNPDSNAEEIDRALEAMELVVPLSEKDIAMKSYHLFHIVMQAPVSNVYTEEKKWEASRLAMHGAYKWDKFLPWVEDPQDVLTFLDHHFDLATRGGENHDEPIQDALRALAYASGPVTIEALEVFDPTEPSFVQGICYVFQEDKPFQLRKAALFFLPLIGHRWFDTANPIMEPDQMRKLCVDWASAVDSIEHTDDVQKATLAVLLGMMNSPHWRPHIVAEKWKLLEYFTSIPDDSQPLKRCLDNPELMDAISKVGSPVAMVLWLAVLWLKYDELIPEVREQLEVATKDVAQGARRTDLDMYLVVMESEIKKAKEGLEGYSTLSTDPVAMVLRTKIGGIQQAKASLTALMGV